MSQIIDKNAVLIAGACAFKEQTNGVRWFISKQEKEGDWEIPKIVTRKAESSVRASIRMMGEKGGASTKVLEEVGRAGGITTVNNKTVPQRHIYYLHILKSENGEPIGFAESAWLPYAKAVRKLASKRERGMLKDARKEYRAWKKRVAKKQKEEERKRREKEAKQNS